MAQAAEKISGTDFSTHGKAADAEALDLAVKKLIDALIVPYLVEEFLRLYGPAAAFTSSHKTNIHSLSQS